jgi:hypothetical protein
MLALSEMLRHAPRYGLRYIFVHDSYYEPLLTFAGWRRIETFNDGDITVWTTVGIPPATAIPSPLRPPAWQGIMWGTVPFGTSLVTILLAFVQRKKTGSVEGPAEGEGGDGAGNATQAAIPASDPADAVQVSTE